MTERRNDRMRAGTSLRSGAAGLGERLGVWLSVLVLTSLTAWSVASAPPVGEQRLDAGGGVELALASQLEGGEPTSADGYLPGVDYTSPHPDDYPYIEPASHWRKISFTLRTEGAVECEFWLIRPLPWLDQHGATVGAPMHIEFEELGLVGDAMVESIEPIGAIARPESGGRNITGKFVTHHVQAFDLHLIDDAGDETVVGTTAPHPFWSVDRDGWVPAGELLLGESVRADEGSLLVGGMTARAGTETVFNLEVHRDHTFRVDTTSVLVHNSCPPKRPRRDWRIDRYDKVVDAGKFGKIYRDPKTKYWWSRDTAGHGGSAWKVFEGTQKGL